MDNQKIRQNSVRPTPQSRPVPNGGAKPQPAVQRPASQQGQVRQQPMPQVPMQAPAQVQPQPTQTYEQPPLMQNGGGTVPPRMAMPTENAFESEFEQEVKVKKSSKGKKVILFSLIGAIVLVAIAFIALKMSDSNSGGISNTLDPNPASQVSTGVNLGESKGTTTTFDGNPIPVKWPADVTPTRMEIQLDPTTGEPIMVLVGDKSGLGTVVRSYNKEGSLSGYWVIVSDDASSTTNTAPAITDGGQSEKPADQNSNTSQSTESTEKTEPTEETSSTE